jgi:tagatose 1,6-diphosphate aldolase GatY/KbaY
MGMGAGENVNLMNPIGLLRDAQKNNYAAAAFNVENMEMAQAVVMAAAAEKAPVILQTTSSTLRYAQPLVFSGMIAALATEVDIPVALHLDHGVSFELSEKAVNAGYTSVKGRVG